MVVPRDFHFPLRGRIMGAVTVGVAGYIFRLRWKKKNRGAGEFEFVKRRMPGTKIRTGQKSNHRAHNLAVISSRMNGFNSENFSMYLPIFSIGTF